MLGLFTTLMTTKKMVDFFLAKIDIFVLFERRYIFCNIFLYGKSIVVFFEKIIFYMLGKFWYCQNFAIFGQNFQILPFFSYIFQNNI